MDYARYLHEALHLCVSINFIPVEFYPLLLIQIEHADLRVQNQAPHVLLISYDASRYWKATQQLYRALRTLPLRLKRSASISETCKTCT